MIPSYKDVLEVVDTVNIRSIREAAMNYYDSEVIDDILYMSKPEFDSRLASNRGKRRWFAKEDYDSQAYGSPSFRSQDACKKYAKAKSLTCISVACANGA